MSPPPLPPHGPTPQIGAVLPANCHVALRGVLCLPNRRSKMPRHRHEDLRKVRVKQDGSFCCLTPALDAPYLETR